MKITLKLFASLAAHLPPDARDRHRVDLDVDPGTTVVDVIRAQRIPESLCAIVLVDGQWVGRPDRASYPLRDGQVLAIWPPVAGGAAAFTRTLDMGVTREEFLRLLTAVVEQFETDEDGVRWDDGERRATIRLIPVSYDHVEQGLTPLRVPRHRVDIALEGWSDEEGEAFMTRFHRAFLRGGG
jgi:sulfur carrier protein ThiS